MKDIMKFENTPLDRHTSSTKIAKGTKDVCAGVWTCVRDWLNGSPFWPKPSTKTEAEMV